MKPTLLLYPIVTLISEAFTRYTMLTELQKIFRMRFIVIDFGEVVYTSSVPETTITSYTYSSAV